MSKAMAEMSSGEVFVALDSSQQGTCSSTFSPKLFGGSSAIEKTIWETDEWPELKSNSKVSQIWRTTLAQPNAKTCSIYKSG